MRHPKMKIQLCDITPIYYNQNYKEFNSELEESIVYNQKNQKFSLKNTDSIIYVYDISKPLSLEEIEEKK